MRVAIVAVACVLGSATTASAEDLHVETTSYWKTTAAVDAVGLGLLVAGGFAEGEGGRDTEASNTLFALGGATVMLGAPLVHAARGHGGRAVKSVLLRGGLAGVGMMLAMGANSGCEGFLCGLDYVGYGMFGGLVVASIVDASMNTTERVRPPRWTPQVAASADGVRVGAAWTW